MNLQMNDTGKGLKFILIDDDNINNFCAQAMIKSVFNNISIITFTDPEKGLQYVETNVSSSGDEITILLLDINMPVMTGWDFLEEFEKMEASYREHLEVYMVSSSVDNRDRSKALSYPSVTGFISKPLTKDFYRHLNFEKLAHKMKIA